MARRIELLSVIRIIHDDHPEDNSMHVVESWDYTRSIEEALEEGIIDDNTDDIISWITSD